MVLHRQTNYFYIDLENKVSTGLIECIIEEKGKYQFFVGYSEIHEVIINNEIVQFKLDQFDENISDNKKLQRKEKLDYKRSITLDLIDNINAITIKYSPNLQYYTSIDESDKHKEALGSACYFISFPYLNLLTEFKLIYVVQSDLTVTSSGQVQSVVEEDDFAVHTYYCMTFPMYISFSIGTFETYEIIPSKTFVLPRYKNYSDLKNDVVAAQKFLDNFLACDKSITISFLFTMMNYKFVSESLIVNHFGVFPIIENIVHNFNFRKKIGYFLAFQLFTKICFLQEDLWIYSGLVGYIGDYVQKSLLGANEFLYEFKKNIEYVVSEDRVHLPLYSESRSAFSYTSKFLRTKSTIFFHILENSTSTAFMQKIIQNLLNLKSITTKNFINVVRDITGKDLDNEKLIFKNTCTTYTGEVSIDLKKNAVKVSFNGPVNTIIQSNEIEGVFEYPIKREVSYNYHNRRKRDDESVLFIKIDPYMTQLNNFKFLLKNTMYNFLTRDKNLISQMDGVRHVDETELERIIYDPHINYHIKLMAMNHLGINSILSFFVKKYCVHGSTIIKPNSFTILNHSILVGLIYTLSYFDPNVERFVNDKNVSVGAIIKAFYYNILRYNDNSSNHFDDSTFISAIITSFSHMMTCGIGIDTQENFYNKNEIYLDIIERYRLKDLVFPSNENLITCAVLYFYGRLDLYGIIEIDENYLFFLIQPKNYIKIRCLASEILTFKLLLCEEHQYDKKNLETLLQQDDKIQKTVLQTILNFLCTDLYNKFVKDRLDQHFLNKILYETEFCDVREKIIQIFNFIESKDIPIGSVDNIDHELSSCEELPEKISLKCIPIGNFRVKLNLRKVERDQIFIKKIKPYFSSNGTVKLQIKNMFTPKRKKPTIAVKRSKIKVSIRSDDLHLEDNFNTNFFVNETVFNETKDECIKITGINSQIQTEFDIYKHLRQIFMENEQKSEKYEQALGLCEKIERSKMKINLAGHFYTLLNADQKNQIKKYLDLLQVPHFSRSKKYKDIARRPQTVYSLKKKLDSVILLESLKLEICRFIENIRFFSNQDDLNSNDLITFLNTIKEDKNYDLYTLLKICFEYLKTKKVSVLFIEQVKSQEYMKIIKKPMYLNLILKKIETQKYRNLQEIENDMNIIISNSVKFNGPFHHITNESRNLFKWYKKIVGGMLADLYRDID